MSDDSRPMSLPPFPAQYRASGVLLHVTSLPSPYGIGDVGPAAVKWIDKLYDAGQSWWQALPLGPDRVRQLSVSILVVFRRQRTPDQPGLADRGWIVARKRLRGTLVFGNRRRLPVWLSRSNADCSRELGVTSAAPRVRSLQAAFEQFCHEQAHWLEDYALFRVLKAKHNGAYYLEWPAELVRRVPAALAQARRELASQIDQVRFAQFLLFRQGERLKKHARAKGVRLIGDLPFFVSPDSSDVWANPELFLLDEHHRPRFVAGVPPDYFSSQGQLWGNPVYNWDALRRTGYRWCIDRLRALLAHVDVIRLDHFRGFAAAWHIPAGATTAQSGEWVPGPGADFFNAVQRELGVLPFIAEDLGLITPDVSALRDQFHVPGTRVLQFAFDGHSDNPYLPHNYVPNTVVYTGTHDNPTSRGWYEELPPYQRQNLWRYLKSPGR